jgi:peptidoglycan/xylan/chitin deacetylase (PgdA/CDA1 family)
MYHSVSEDPTPATSGLSVRPADLAAQLDLLVEQGFVSIPVSTALRYWRSEAAAAPDAEPPELPSRPVALTFDDGYADFHTQVLPMLERRGMTASLFVTTGWLHDAGPTRAGRPLAPMLSWGQIDEIAAAGVEVGDHGHSHAPLDQLGQEALVREVLQCRHLLEDRLHRPCQVFCYPYGYSSARVRSVVRSAGYSGACAVANALAATRQGPYALARLTVRRSTTLAAFEQAVHGVALQRLYLREHALTRGYAVVRRSRYGLNKLLRRV